MGAICWKGLFAIGHHSGARLGAAAQGRRGKLRQRLPRGVSDEELLLRFGMPAEEVDAMLAAAPAARHYTPEVQPVLRLLRELGSRPPADRLVVDKPGFRLSLKGHHDHA